MVTLQTVLDGVKGSLESSSLEAMKDHASVVISRHSALDTGPTIGSVR